MEFERHNDIIIQHNARTGSKARIWMDIILKNEIKAQAALENKELWQLLEIAVVYYLMSNGVEIIEEPQAKADEDDDILY
jgi:hypothetical protein